MKRLATTVVLIAAALATAGVAMGAQSLNFQADDKAVFPNVTYRVTLPKSQALGVDRVAVSENGGPVDSLYVTTPGTGGNTNGTVLLIDTSNSMAGAPIDNAVEAAKAFAARRNPNQQLAIIGFDGEVDVLLPFTTSQVEIDAALARPIDLEQGTRIYDGVKESLDLIAANGLQTSSIVLLSDGADVGSDTSREDTVERLEGGTTRVFSVGLRSGAFQSSSLQALAEASDGQYEEATSASELTPIFDAIGFKLANEYEVSWRSLQGPGTPVNVVIAVNGFAPYTSSYTTPDLPEPPPVTYEETFLDSIIQSWVFMLVVILIAAALIGYAVFIATRKPDETLRRRLGQYVTIQSEDEARKRRQEIAMLTATKTERRRTRKWFTSLEYDLDIANWSISPAAFVAATVGGTLLGMVVLGLIMQSWWGVLIALIAGPLIARWILKHKISRRRRDFGEQLPDNLDVLAGALRAGHSLVSGIAVMADDAAEPSKSEYRRVLADEQLGVPLDEALGVTVRRMDNRDLDQVAIVAALQRDTGGNSAEVLDQVAENVRGRMELRRLIRVLTAQGRLARWIVSLLPLALMGGIYLIQPDYLDPLFSEAIGKFLIVVAIIMIITGSLIIKKIVDIDV